MLISMFRIYGQWFAHFKGKTDLQSIQPADDCVERVVGERKLYAHGNGSQEIERLWISVSNLFKHKYTANFKTVRLAKICCFVTGFHDYELMFERKILHDFFFLSSLKIKISASLYCDRCIESSQLAFCTFNRHNIIPHPSISCSSPVKPTKGVFVCYFFLLVLQDHFERFSLLANTMHEDFFRLIEIWMELCIEG